MVVGRTLGVMTVLGIYTISFVPHSVYGEQSMIKQLNDARQGFPRENETGQGGEYVTTGRSRTGREAGYLDGTEVSVPSTWELRRNTLRYMRQAEIFVPTTFPYMNKKQRPVVTDNRWQQR